MIADEYAIGSITGGMIDCMELSADPTEAGWLDVGSGDSFGGVPGEEADCGVPSMGCISLDAGLADGSSGSPCNNGGGGSGIDA